MDNIQKLKESILKEYEHLTENDCFNFECGPHLECFNDCCADVNIFLTPYDVLRMRTALKISSGEFLKKYTIIPFDDKQTLPVPLMLMQDTDRKQCHFVDDETGCTIYHDRPWPCRMYPIGLGSPGGAKGFRDERFYFVMKEDHCKGFNRPTKWSIKEWMEDQGVKSFDEFGELFKNITLHPRFATGWKPTPKFVEIYWLALYDLDRFRIFVLESTFLNRFEIDEEELASYQTDDESLLRLGFKWVKMALFGEKTIPIRDEQGQKEQILSKQK